MEEKNKVEQLIGNVKDYVETRFDIVSLNVQEKVSEILSSIASVIIIALLGVFILFFSSIGIAWWIGKELNNPSIGFFYVAGFYLLVVIIISVNHNKWIKLPLINTFLKKINFHEEG